MKKIIFMGAIGCGKTTLTQALHGEQLDYDKTQALQFHEDIIDTPGEYILHRRFIQSLTVTAADSDVIGLVQSVIEQEQVFSVGFGKIFSKEIIGIITKMDLNENLENVKFVEEQLLEAGAEKIFHVSAVNQDGVEEIKDYLGHL
jgi:ethanolamine utilization protein EutP